ncbi:hypothetical protein T4D_8485 [Trichinella pseudospiralis]|uniref:Uncharacterized protein n=1 Tax=Trichinella pseudospiralis TaxID=6337 RepID=A0A0V1F849_TRIPS|nr:hypothetical protein T4D_8485 [Trichinella pseudospiralis]
MTKLVQKATSCKLFKKIDQQLNKNLFTISNIKIVSNPHPHQTCLMRKKTSSLINDERRLTGFTLERAITHHHHNNKSDRSIPGNGLICFAESRKAQLNALIQAIILSLSDNTD